MAAWREPLPTEQELRQNSTKHLGFTKKGWGQFYCERCDTSATMVKHLQMHWDGKKHQEPVVPESPSSNVVVPTARKRKQREDERRQSPPPKRPVLHRKGSGRFTFDPSKFA